MQEISSILNVLPEPSRTVFAVAAYGGLRRGEVIRLSLEDHKGGTLAITRSIWGKHVNAPKTRKSMGAVPVIKQLAERLEYRLRCGNPKSGPMFTNLNGKPTSIDNLLHRQILPALNKCKVCGKQESEHVLPDHEYKRNDALPEWRGFHAARRGLAARIPYLCWFRRCWCVSVPIGESLQKRLGVAWLERKCRNKFLPIAFHILGEVLGANVMDASTSTNQNL